MLKERATVVLDKHYRSQDDTYPISIEVTFQQREKKSGRRIRKYYSTGFSCLEKGYVALTARPRTPKDEKAKEKIDALLNNAIKILEQNPNAPISLFEARFFGVALNTLNGSFEKMITELKAEDRIGSAKAYQTALNSLKTFAMWPETNEDKIKVCEIRFSEVSIDWLGRYERWMIKQGGAVNSIGIHLRTLRAVFNRAIRDKVIPESLYPFESYKIRSEIKYKVPASEVELGKLKGSTPADPLQAEALDYWKFSYYCNGMNMMDIAGLRHSDIQDDFILYDRSKTRRTKIRFKKIIIPIDHEILEIVKRRGAPTLNPNAYVFPILEEGLSAVTIKNRVGKWTTRINEGLEKLSGKLELKKKLTMVIARHTFANRMSNLDADGRMIQEALGHQKAETTEHYRGSLYTEKIRKTREGL